jgi:hypothetical protein
MKAPHPSLRQAGRRVLSIFPPGECVDPPRPLPCQHPALPLGCEQCLPAEHAVGLAPPTNPVRLATGPTVPRMLTVLAQEDRTSGSPVDVEPDRSCGSGHQRDRRTIATFAVDLHDRVTPFEAEGLDVSIECLGKPQCIRHVQRFVSGRGPQ